MVVIRDVLYIISFPFSNLSILFNTLLLFFFRFFIDISKHTA